MNAFDKIKAANPSWFAPETMRFFRSRVSQKYYTVPGGAVFVTSEQFDDRSPRLYTVRYGTERGITTEGEGFQGYASRREAHQAARALARELGGES